MECPQCHTINPQTAASCSKCGTAFNFNAATMAAVDAAILPVSEVGKGWSVPGSLAAIDAPLAHGTIFGRRYEIIQLLGQGGMGAVYKAKDRELERFVALKVIRPELAVDPEILARFKQELVLARQVTHKNVIRIFDLGEADGIKFITMEFIEGQQLKSLITEKGRLSEDEIVHVMEQVCMALEAAHGEGVVHRDLKPQNIMIDTEGKVSVMDFGIARSTEMGGMTRTGTLLGTPEYMSPEQVMGEQVDTRSDLFTFGVIFYQLLVGEVPYKADTVQAAIFKRIRERPKPPIEVNPAVPKMLSDITAKCLEMDPTARYQSASEILTDLEIWKSGGTKVFPTAIQVEVQPPLAAAKRWIAGGVGALVLILAVSVWVFRERLYSGSSGATPTAPAMSLAILPFRNASNDQSLDWLGSSIAEILSTGVGQSARLRTVSPDRVGQIFRDLRIGPEATLDAPTIQRVAQLGNANTIVWGQYAKFGEKITIDATIEDLRRGHTTELKAEAARDRDVLATMDRLAAEIRQNLNLSGSEMKELQARSFKPSSMSLPALHDYNKGLQLERQGKDLESVKQFEASTIEDPNFALAYSQLADVYEDMGQDNEAEQYSQKAVELGKNLPDVEKKLIVARNDQILNNYPKAIEEYQNIVKFIPDNADVLFDFARLEELSGDFAKAHDTFAKVLTLDPKRVDGLLAMGRIEIESGRDQSGLDYLNRARSVANEIGSDEMKALILQAIGIAYSDLNQPQDAIRNFEQSLEIKRRLGLKRGIADSLQMIGQMEAILGKNDAALKDLSEALEVRREIGDKSGTGDVLNDIAFFYNDHSQFDKALPLLKQALQIQMDVGNESAQALALKNIGNTYFFKDDYEDAKTYFARTLSIYEKINVPSEVGDALHNLADTSMMLGQYDQAIEQYLRALDIRRTGNDKRGAAIESASLGVIFGYQGRYSAALGSEQDALKTLREMNETDKWLAEVLTYVGRALAQLGNSDDARKYLDEAIKDARETKNEIQVTQALNDEGDTYFYQGDYKSAGVLYQQALESATKTSNRQLPVLSKVNLAKLAIKQSNAASAVSALRGLSNETENFGMKYLSVECSVYLGEALIDTKNFPKAINELSRALNRSEKLGLRELAVQSQYLLGRALLLSGDSKEAARHFDEARRGLSEIQTEAKTDAVVKRSDLSPILNSTK